MVVGMLILLKLDNIDESPIETWKEYKNGCDNDNRTLHSSSPKTTKKTMDGIMTVVKNSSEFHSVMQAGASSSCSQKKS